MNKKNSPYTATITGCAFLYNEYLRILPLLMYENATELLKDEVKTNQILQVNSQKARQTFITEFKRRYNAVPISFWTSFQTMSEQAQRAGLLYAILKAYKLAFDFHFNVTVKCISFVGNSIGGTQFRDKVNDTDMEGNLLHQFETIMSFFTRNLNVITIERDSVIIGVDLNTSQQGSDTNPNTFGANSDTNLNTSATTPNTFSDKSDITPDTLKGIPDIKKSKLSGKQKDVVNLCSVPRSSREILERVGVKYHSTNIKKYITDLINMDFLERTIPDQPFDSNQKYRKKLK